MPGSDAGPPGRKPATAGRPHGTAVVMGVVLAIIAAAGAPAAGGEPGEAASGAAEAGSPAAADEPVFPWGSGPPEAPVRPGPGARRPNLLKRWALDQRFLVTRWWGSEFRRPGFVIPLAIGLSLAGTSGGSAPGLDERLARGLRGDAGGRDGAVLRGISQLGDTETAFVLVGGAFLLSRAGGNERFSRSSGLAAEALLSAGAWNVALKRLARRSRPVAGGSGDFFSDRLPDGQSSGSFPSGHAMGTFAVATVLAGEYGDRRWVPWVAYSTAGLVGGSRVALGKHFPSDVLIGALLGHSIGRMVLARERGEDRPTPLRLEPMVTPDGTGYGLAWVRSW